jgi:WD40 repeat protein/tRNA A-37 threonylcarbamoyl transferase component Bud32
MPITPGETILNKYRVIKLIGEGGMARVWLAEETTFAGRLVAIKEPRRNLLPGDRDEVERRYQREIQIGAALDAAGVPNVVRALTADHYEGNLLLVMQYMPGGDLAGLLAGHPNGLPVEQAVQIARDICAALAGVHGHTLEIVHRDIKPSNILFDDKGVAHLADFGLAQVGNLSQRSQLAGGGHPGTPLYMAPEHQWGSGYLPPAADIFALGCVLFEMLTGQRYKNRPGTRARSLRREVPVWIDGVLSKALTEDSFARWQSAADLTQALEAGITRKSLAGAIGGFHLPIGPRTLAAAAGALVIILLAILVLPGLLGGGGEPIESTMVVQLATATDTWTPAPTGTAVPATDTPLPPTATATSIPPTATATGTATHTFTPLPPTPTATRTHTPAPPTATISIVPTDLGEPPGTTGPRLPNTFVLAGIDYRLIGGGIGVVVLILVGVFQKERLRRILLASWKRTRAIGASGNVPSTRSVGISLRVLESALDTLRQAFSRAVALIMTATRQRHAMQIMPLETRGKGTISGFAWSPDGGTLALATALGIYLYDANTFEEVRFIRTRCWVTCVAFSPDGRTVLAGNQDGTVRLWKLSNGRCLRTLRGHTAKVKSVAFSPDGRILASNCQHSEGRLWRFSDGLPLCILAGGCKTNLVFSPDGRILASGTYGNSILLWKVADGTRLRELEGHTNSVWGVAFSPDGEILASGSRDKNTCLWRVSDGVLLHTLTGHADTVWSVAFSPRGEMLTSGSCDNDVRVWRVSDGVLLHTLIGHTDSVQEVAFSPHGDIVASRDQHGVVSLWSVTGEKLLHTFENHMGSVKDVAISRDGRMLASASDDRSVRLWSASSETPSFTLREHYDRVRGLAFSPDGKMIMALCNDGTTQLWRVSDGGKMPKPLSGADTGTMTFSPDGRMLASGSTDGSIRLWEVSNWRLLDIDLRFGSIGRVNCMAFSPDGGLLAAGYPSGKIMLRNISNDKLSYHNSPFELEWHGAAMSIAFSPDGKVLVCGTEEGPIWLWRISDGALLDWWEGHTDWVRSVAFSPNGEMLVSGSFDKTIRIWRVSDGKTLCTLADHTGKVYRVAFSPDGKTLVSGSEDGTMRLWGIPTR